MKKIKSLTKNGKKITIEQSQKDSRFYVRVYQDGKVSFSVSSSKRQFADQIFEGMIQ